MEYRVLSAACGRISSSWRRPSVWRQARLRSSRATRAATAPRDRAKKDDKEDPSATQTADADDTLQARHAEIFSGFKLSPAPRHVGEGLVVGASKVLVGVARGAAGLVTVPLMGAYQGGLQGFAFGSLGGVLCAVVEPAKGIVQGVGSVVGGLRNTPDAITAARDGKEWDPVLRRWVRYSLKEEYQRVLAEEKDAAEAAQASTQSEDARSSTSAREEVVDTHFYGLLGVPPSATAAQIKGAYYKAAKIYHPDLNPSNDEANRKFQELSKAYQVLSNKKLRDSYDSYGREAAEHVNIVDAALFFNMLFGIEKLEPYIGTLRLSDLFSDMGESAERPLLASGKEEDSEEAQGLLQILFSEKSKRRQNTRAVKCAVHLAGVLDGYITEGKDMQGLRRWARKEAEELVKGAFAPSMVHEIGCAYENMAHEVLGYDQSLLGLGSIVARSQRTRARLQKGVDISRAVYDAYRAIKEIQKLMPKDMAANPASERLEDEHKLQMAFQERLPVLLRACNRVSLFDVSETVASASKKVLRDNSVDPATRRKHADALLVLGQVFRETGETHMSTAEKQIKEHIYDAMEKSVKQDR